MNQPTYYEILGVEKNSNQEEIKKAYRSAAKKYHPDANEVANATLIFRMINEAYDILSDTAKRREYDRTLDAPKAQQPSSPQPQREAYTHHRPDPAPQTNHTTYTYTFYEEAEEPSQAVSRRKLPFPLSAIWAIIRTLLKIVFVPSLSVLVWFFSMTTGLLMVASYLASGLLFIAVLVSWWNYFSGGMYGIPVQGILGAIIAYAISPMGLPRIVGWLVGKMEDFRLFIKNL